MIDIEVLREIQKKLSRYLFMKGFLSWNGIRNTCRRIILSLPKETRDLFKDKSYPEFEIFIPLLRNGTAEVCKNKERSTLLFCMNPNVNLKMLDGREFVRGDEFFSIHKTKEKVERNKYKYREDIPFELVFNSMSFLKTFPSIDQQITTFSEQDINLSRFYYVQSLMNYRYEKKNLKDIAVGIYKLDDKAWTSAYLFDKNKKIRKIPYYAEDPDAMNLARLYVRINNPGYTKPIFEYDKKLQELICFRYSEMPILLTRSLILFEPTQLLLKEFCTNHPTVPFKNIPEGVIEELKRIFSDKAIVVK